MSFQFKIEQVALSVDPSRRKQAVALLVELGMKDWVSDTVVARGTVGDLKEEVTNVGELSFNYDAATEGKLELELLHYSAGDNFVDRAKREHDTKAITTHLGMHVTASHLGTVEGIMKRHGIGLSQQVETVSHTNKHIRDSRRYKYAIFATRSLIGVDLKFIVRKELEKEPA